MRKLSEKTQNTTMGKDSNKHFVDQPILQQITDLILRGIFDKLILELRLNEPNAK